MFIVILLCCFGQILASQVKYTTTENPECDCGEGAVSCTFNNETVKKQCDCEDGYAFDSRDFRNKCISCKGWCNENAKTCVVSLDDVVSCVCKDGFKVEETNYQCEECDCGPNGNCTFRYGPYTECLCDSGYAEDVDGKCSACDCGPRSTRCHLSKFTGIKTCDCEDGFEDKKGICEKCDCGSGQDNCYFDNENDGSKICSCKSDMYFLRNGFCEECDCGSHGKCDFSMVTGLKHCTCDRGFTDLDGKCVACDCGPETFKCYYSVDFGKECNCELGFMPKLGTCEKCDCGPGGSYCSFDDENGSKNCVCKNDKYFLRNNTCEDINECLSLSDPCGPDLLCNNLLGSYECLCKTGYLPEKFDENPKYNTCYKVYGSGWRTATIIMGITLSGFIIVLVSMAIMKYRRNSRYRH